MQSDSGAETHVSSSFLATKPVEENTGLRQRRKRGCRLQAICSFFQCGWLDVCTLYETGVSPLLSKTYRLHLLTQSTHDKGKANGSRARSGP